MRLIGTLLNENDARRLTLFLKTKGIETNCDISFDASTGHMTYQVWAIDEDRIAEAQLDFDRFAQEPSHAAFDMPITEALDPENLADAPEEKILPPRRATPFTTFIIALCSLIFFLNLFQEYPLLKEGFSDKTFIMTPIQSALLFDLPPAIVQLEEVIQKHEIQADQKIETLSPEARLEMEKLNHLPFWRGLYDWVLLKIQGKDTSLSEGPLFHSILQGEIWRLFSPAILHTDFLHILFNMIWVWVLCRPIEQRIGILRLLILSLCVAIGSNIAQYLMSGPFFIGYSGVVMGLAGFTWMREKIAPWEGYPMTGSTFAFLLLFIGGMFLVQFVSFILQIFTHIGFSPNIANTAHISGALIGIAFARAPFFSERVVR